MSLSSVKRSADLKPPIAAWKKQPAVLSQTERAEQRAVSRDDEPFAAELETDAKIPRSTSPPTRGSEQDTPSVSQQNSKMMLFRFTEQATFENIGPSLLQKALITPDWNSLHFILEQRTLPATRRNLEILIGQLRSNAPARSSVQKSNLHQERFINLFNCVRLLR